MSEQIETGIKKPRRRGMAKKSLDMIEAMRALIEPAQPITGRGVGYKLFAAGLIPSMARAEMQKVYRLLKEARERRMIPWHWIVDETRELERAPSWDDPEDYARAVINSYRRDYWNQQPVRIEVWSEKGTVRGVLAPVLDEYGVGFRVMHGFGSATQVYEIARSRRKKLIALNVGDWDPSGMCMSKRDLPDWLAEYGGRHVKLYRIALTEDQIEDLPSFPASDKEDDPRHDWFVENYGHECWELDALDPNDLRTCVEEAIMAWIEWDAWDRCKTVEAAEQETLELIMQQWG